DAGISPADIGMGIFANVLSGKLFGDLTVGQNAFAEMGMPRIPVFNVENACASGSSAVHLACMAIRAGEVECAMVIGA
ncbi:MAG TPA: thiolase, partial [Syntrophus sp. (in: bacteria)]|nr:thiolase [Syntrophus sp. (in: bacteria)]